MLAKSKPDANLLTKPDAEYATCYEHAKPNAKPNANLLAKSKPNANLLAKSKPDANLLANAKPNANMLHAMNYAKPNAKPDANMLHAMNYAKPNTCQQMQNQMQTCQQILVS